MTALVVCTSRTAAVGVISVLREAGLSLDRSGDRSILLVEDVAGIARRRSLRRFTAPRLIVVSHDPVALIAELGRDGDTPAMGVRRAKARIDLIFDIALKAACPVLLLSHGLAQGRPELADILRAFCGLGPAGAAAQPADGAGSPSPPPTRGAVVLRCDGGPPKARVPRTIVIGGPPRSGTSMVAAVLHAAGLPLGKSLVPSTFENAQQNMLFKPSSNDGWRARLNGSWRAAVANPRHVRLAWRGFDVPGLKALIAERREDGPVWGLKRPGLGSFVRLGGLRLLDDPRLVMSLRDPVAAAARITRAHDVDGRVALRIARWFLVDSLETALACTAPTLLVSHDAARREPSVLFDRLLSFCGLDVDARRYDEIAASVERAGATYRRDFAEPFVGEIMDIVDHDLCGWVDGGQDRPVVIDIFADDRRIASASADEVIDEAGRLFFRIALSPSDVTNATRIRAALASSRTELRNSGASVEALRRAGEGGMI